MKLEDICRQLLLAIGENPDREGLRDTPRRWAKWWREFSRYRPGKTSTTFRAEGTDQMVLVSGLRVWSLCEHHLLPFWCDISIGYIARKHIIGLSKMARLAHQASHRLQVQERLVHEIADGVRMRARTPDVAVLAEGEHLCMTMRGIKTPGRMVSSVMLGNFRTEPSARAEFLALVRRG